MTLRALRVNKRKTQHEAAKDLNISIDTLKNYESGRTYPDVPMIRRIEAYYGVNYDSIEFF
ncbi:helix-turn-helix transcriptional regulator [Veillonella magna]|nr:helix-turn-helix transcriptional regulator [Veillonella magna]